MLRIKKKVLFLFFSCLTFLQLNAQKYVLSGYVRDGKTGEELLYATVGVKGTTLGTTTNAYGFFSITLPSGKYEIVYNFVGYSPKTVAVTLDKDQEQIVQLETGEQVLQEVIVEAKARNENVTKNETGTVSLDIKEAKKIPVLMGEQDVLKTIQLLPGVKGSSEGNTGFFVRGGNADQNLILLDEAPVYNASHLLGFFSVFNSDALKDVKLYKGGMPAQYGGRASSVLDIKMKNGNNKHLSASGGIGLISSRLTVEAPIVKDKGSIILSGRRTYMDVLAKAAGAIDKNDALYFYDLNLKANYTLSDKDRLYMSGYLGKDNFGATDNGFSWGNKTATLRWNHTFNPKLFVNTSAIYSDYGYGFKTKEEKNTITLTSGIQDWNLKQDYNFYLNPKNTLSFGLNVIKHTLRPGTFTTTDTAQSKNNLKIAQRQAYETGLYVSNDQKINDKFSLNYGIRFSIFNNIGPFEQKEYNAKGDITKVKKYTENQLVNTYTGLEPRLSATYLLSDNSSVKAGYNRNFQYLHLLSNSSAGDPTDMWLMSSPIFKPLKSDQVSIGYFHNLEDNMYEASLEAYYKNFKNLGDYKDGANVFLNPDIEAELVFGKGRAYGAEFLVRKNKGRLTGWIGYTLSKTERQFEAINDGQWYSARQDRTHDISIVTMYQLSKKWSLSGVWVYNTGDAVTFPSGKYRVEWYNYEYLHPAQWLSYARLSSSRCERSLDTKKH